MLTTDPVAIFADSRTVHADALRLLEAGDIRKAAGKAWYATKLATDALNLARTGVEPEISSDTPKGLARLATEDQAVHPLFTRYHIRHGHLYGDCFRLGICAPIDEVERRIRQTADYISTAARLAGYPDVVCHTEQQTPMVTTTDHVSAIFADARAVHADALRLLEAGDIRDAAEKAWCATKRATDALILARTGETTELSPATTQGLVALAAEDRNIWSLRRRYFSRQSELHGACFYLGACEPIEEVERRIRQTADYINDAERLAGYSNST